VDLTELTKHLELSLKMFEEGRELVDRDPVQASEKLYKAAEECVKALALFYSEQDEKLRRIISHVEERGTWKLDELTRAAHRLGQILGEDIRTGWDTALVLHILGFHEAKLSSDEVKARIPQVEQLLVACRVIHKVITGVK